MGCLPRLGAIVLCLLLGAGAPAADRDAALAVVNEAVTAQGGAEALEAGHVRVRQAAGVTTPKDQGPISFTEELTLDLPGRLRHVVDVSAQGVKRQVIQVLDRDHGWRSISGNVSDLARDDLEELQEEAFVAWIATLVPLRAPEFKLSLLPQTEIDGRPAAVVRVRTRGHPDSHLFFDRRSGLLVKIERQAPFVGVRVKRTYVYKDYRNFGSLRLPTREVQFIHADKWTELSIRSYRFPGHVDDSLFKKP